MNPAIEYALRRIEQMLLIPCSLFLENNEGKMVVTLNQVYGSKSIIVRQYKLWEDTPYMTIPPCQEFYTTKSKVFTDPNVIISDFELLAFIQSSFPSEEVQTSDFPLASTQEKRYHDHLSYFYSPKRLNQIREDWLWQEFYKSRLSKDIKFEVKLIPPPHIKIYIKKNYHKIYKNWEAWEKHLLLNSNPASELVFQKYYKINHDL